MAPTLRTWGAARTVTGSMHHIQFKGKQLLLDCGMYQGRRKDAFEINRDFPFDPTQIDAVILSHAHIDHSGNLPSLIKSGFRGPIYCTSATRDLAVFLLLDAGDIQVSDVAYINRKRKREGKRPFEPLYTPQDAKQTIEHFRTVEYHSTFEPIRGIECTFFDAGHMLGSASIALDWQSRHRNKKVRFVFSGDIGRAEIPMLRDPEAIPDADFVLMESTYGNRVHEKSGDATEALKELVETTFASGGKLIIPAFSVGRTQELVYRLNHLAEAGEIPEIFVFVDSPLASNATGVFKSHPECFNDEAFERILVEEDQDPLAFKNLAFIRKAEHSKQLNDFKEPAIIIASSGMCESGRIVHHLKHHIEDPNTTIVFSGYQAANTLGRKILDGSEYVSIHGSDRKVNAKITKLPSTSGHADQQELITWLSAVAEKGDLKRTWLVHGELEAAEVLQKELEQAGLGPVEIPQRGQEMELTIR